MTDHDLPLLEAVLADLEDRGYRIARSDDRSGPPAVAAGAAAFGEPTDAALAVEPVAEPTPLSTVAPLAAAARAGRRPLLVADDHDARRALEVLCEPPFLRDEREGGRRFFSIPERVRLRDDTYACVRTDGALSWRESATREDPSTTGDGSNGSVNAPGRTGTDEPTLLLEADGSVVAAFPSVASLTCPGPDPGAFRHRYARGSDGRFRVFDRERTVGTYGGVAAMRANAYRPVSMPLVPEHHVRAGGRLARGWILAIVEDDDVRYVQDEPKND